MGQCDAGGDRVRQPRRPNGPRWATSRPTPWQRSSASDSFARVTGGFVQQDDLTAWSTAELLRSKLARICGQVRFQGSALAKTGDDTLSSPASALASTARCSSAASITASGTATGSRTWTSACRRDGTPTSARRPSRRPPGTCRRFAAFRRGVVKQIDRGPGRRIPRAGDAAARSRRQHRRLGPAGDPLRVECRRHGVLSRDWRRSDRRLHERGPTIPGRSRQRVQRETGARLSARRQRTRSRGSRRDRRWS